jgi:hypothetical protein
MAASKRNVVMGIASVVLFVGIAGCDPMTGGGTWSAIGKESLVYTTIPDGQGGAIKAVADTLTGMLVDAQGRAVPGTAFRDQCYRAVSSAGPKAGALITRCTLILNTGSHLYGAATKLVGDLAVIAPTNPSKPVADPDGIHGLFGQFEALDRTGGFKVDEVSHPSPGTYMLRIRAFH